MISIDGRPVRTCEGISRREWLRVGGLSTFGLTLPDLASGQTATQPARGAVSSSFGRAKSCIVLFMFGAPAHQDTWDMKEQAPAEVRGEFQPIPTNVPGLIVCEHLPELAKRADRYSLIRSVTHPDNTHTVAMHYMLTGVRHKRPRTNPENAPDDFPCFGSVVSYARQQPGPFSGQALRSLERKASPRDLLPPAISLNAPANQVSANNHIFPGFFAGFLGAAYDPLFVSQHANKPDFDPFPRIKSPDRLLDQKRLLREMDRQARHLEHTAPARTLDSHYEQAFRLLTSPATRRAFDLGTEPEALRARYGMTPFGQGCLLARRLVEAGVPLVTVNWERDDAYWDTHADNFNRHKKQLLPNLDQGFSALLDDLEQRGLLEDTLIVWLAEFGRTPKINKNAGRDHWAACNTVLLSGAGIPGGYVHGASDRLAAYPTRDPVHPEDLAATIYHLLGIPPQMAIRTPQGRPIHLSNGELIRPLV